MKYKIYLDELETNSNKIVDYSKNTINSKINELDKIFDNLNWRGKAANTYLNGYKTRIDKLYKINDNITKLAQYLQSGFTDFNETNNDLSKSWDAFIDETDGDNDEL